MAAGKDRHSFYKEYRNMTRQEANLKLLELITGEVNSNPDLRFNQILVSLGLTRTEFGTFYQLTFNHLDYYEEPEITLQRISK